VTAEDDIARRRGALALVRRALDRPEVERAQWVAAQAGGDDALAREALGLLELDRVADPLTDGAQPVADDPLQGAIIGRFRIEQRIGSGGMGAVYRAVPVEGAARQRVALKLVKRGMDSEEVLARFLREREILARLDHPHIARLLDGGLTTDGRPWFALELVDGEPLSQWCDAQRLDVDARIALFVDVCDAVAFAHRNLVVHRDLKPANVFVAHAGGVKLLDFGIAKMLDGDNADATRATRPPMTPEYAAPEQFERLCGIALESLRAGTTTPEYRFTLIGRRSRALCARPHWPTYPAGSTSRRSSVQAGCRSSSAPAATRRFGPSKSWTPKWVTGTSSDRWSASTSRALSRGTTS